MNNYITIAEAAKLHQTTVQALYQAIQRGVLKRKKIGGKIHTTKEWLDDYERDLHDRDLHSVYNGKHVYNPAKGEYSVRQFAHMLGQEWHNVQYYLKLGKIKGFKRGQYWIIREDQLQIAQEYFEEKSA